MKLAPRFEIKVALLGNVSAGKTTIMNALFRDKFSEVSMKRTTAGVNYFRIWQKAKDESEPEASEASQASWSCAPDEMRTAESTLREITTDNELLRKVESVDEKTFDIELDEDILEMRGDTKLVVVDIPGLNENGASRKYKDYVTEKWGTFDCVILVMDGRYGVNTEEQVSLLKFAKSNIDAIKKLPVIILLNKIDDIYDEELSELVRESKREIEKIFAVDDRDSALAKLFQLKMSGGKQTPCRGRLYPVVMSLSGISAFIFRCCSSMPLEKFRKLDRLLLARLGRNRVGQVIWDSMSEEKRIQSAYRLVSDPLLCTAGLRGSNFDKFLIVLEFTLGGVQKQQKLIERQLEYSVKSIEYFSKSLSSPQLAKRIREAHTLVVRFYADEEDKGGNEKLCVDMKETFWRLFGEYREDAFEKFASPSEVEVLSGPAAELRDYCLLARGLEWKDELGKAEKEFESIVRRQIEFLLSKEVMKASKVASKKQSSDSEETDAWVAFTRSGLASKLAPKKRSSDSEDKSAWSALASIDWFKIFGSINLLSYNRFFCERFGNEKLILDLLVGKHREQVNKSQSQKEDCPHCKREVDESRYCHYCCRQLVDRSSLIAHPKLGSSYYRCPNYQQTRCDGYVRDNGDGYCNSCGQYVSIVVTGYLDIECKKCQEYLDKEMYCKACRIHYRPHFNCLECPKTTCNGKLETLQGTANKEKCKACKTVFQALPSRTEQLKSRGQIKVPNSLSDPKHFGHVSWLYCELMEKLHPKK